MSYREFFLQISGKQRVECVPPIQAWMIHAGGLRDWILGRAFRLSYCTVYGKSSERAVSLLFQIKRKKK